MEEISATTEPTSNENYDALISIFVDGNDVQRSDALHHIVRSVSLDRRSLAIRLRREIRERFSPESEADSSIALRDIKRISSIRSWLLSALIWCDPEQSETKALVFKHVDPAYEPDPNVMFWTLAGVYQKRVSYLYEAAQIPYEHNAEEVIAEEVVLLARAIAQPDDERFIDQCREMLSASMFSKARNVLRLLRIVPIPELVPDVCKNIDRSLVGNPFTYDTL